MSYTVRTLSIDEVREVLKDEGYESVREHIQERDGKYQLKEEASAISPRPSYHYAFGLTFMTLGNNGAAEKACGSLWRYLGQGAFQNRQRAEIQTSKIFTLRFQIREAVR
jgi:hypothetical protein